MYNLISETCKPPDHSMLCLEFVPFVMNKLGVENDNSQFQSANNSSLNNHYNVSCNEPYCENVNSMYYNKRYVFDNIPVTFRNNDVWKMSMNMLITKFENIIQTQEQLNDLYKQTCEVLLSEMDKFLQFKTVGRKSKKRYKNTKPFWDNELTMAWKTMADSEKVYLKFKGPRHEKLCLQAQFKHSRKLFDKMLRQKERRYNKNYIEHIETICFDNPRKFWQQIKSMGSKKSSVPMSVYNNGSLTSDNNIVLSKWKSEFESLYAESNCNQFDDVFYANICNDNVLKERHMLNSNSHNMTINADITFDEIHKLVTKAKLNKSVGIDMVPNEILNHRDVILLLKCLFQFCFNNNCVPSCWLKSILTPIPKGAGNDPYCPLSYRAVSLISCIAKMYTGVINNRLVSYLDDMNILEEEQYGFRKGKSCEDQVYNLTSIIKNRLLNGKTTFAAFIDMAKAFDNVNRNLLLHKLLNHNIDGKLYFAIKALYSNTENCIRLNNLYTDWFSCNLGVRQGDTMSPTLFNIYINDLTTELKSHKYGVKVGDKHICILLYADDIVMVSETEQNLQSMLNIVSKWCQKWRLSVNDTKSEIVHFRNKNKKQTTSKFYMGNKTLNLASKYKYLGVILDENLTFVECAKTLCESAGRALAKIISKFKTFKNITFQTFTKLYDSCVWPILDYCSSIWAHGKSSFAEKVQNRAIRYFLGVHRNAPIQAIQAEMGWILPKYKFYMSSIRLWNRICKSNNSLTEYIHEYCMQNFLNNSWESQLYDIFDDLNMSDCFDNRNECDISYVFNNV